MASVTATKPGLIDQLIAKTHKTAEDHRILAEHFTKLASRAFKQAYKLAPLPFDDDETVSEEAATEYREYANKRDFHKRAWKAKSAQVRAERSLSPTDSYEVIS